VKPDGLPIVEASAALAPLERPATSGSVGRYAWMPQYLDALERAFQIARSGRVDSVVDLRKALKREGFDERVVEGHALSRQLLRLIKDAKPAGPHAPPERPRDSLQNEK
jgi:hypothetical protein